MEMDIKRFKINLPRGVTGTYGKSKFVLNKNAPHILTGVGVAGIIATAVLSYRAAVKAQSPIADLKEKQFYIVERENDEQYTPTVQKAELANLYRDEFPKLAIVFAPPVIAGAVSIAAILTAHGLMMRRNAALVAAYGVLDTAYRAYRTRVREELGEEKELQLYRGIRKVESVNEEGEACEIEDFSDLKASPYSKFFDETSKNWKPHPEYNLMFLHSQQEWANYRLHAYGYLYLNEVLESLGLPRQQMGQIVGWKTKENGGRDGFVDFGIYNIADDNSRAFVNGFEHTVLLDFNVDGPIEITGKER